MYKMTIAHIGRFDKSMKSSVAYRTKGMHSALSSKLRFLNTNNTVSESIFLGLIVDVNLSRLTFELSGPKGRSLFGSGGGP